MAKGPGPILLLGGLAALLIAAKKKPTNGRVEDLPEPPGPGPGPLPEPEPEPGPVEVEVPGSELPPGSYGILAQREYILPYITGTQGDIDVFILGAPGETPIEGVYGPNEDYVWEKETKKDHMIIQFQKPGMYSVRLWEDPEATKVFADYDFRVIEA